MESSLGNQKKPHTTLEPKGAVIFGHDVQLQWYWRDTSCPLRGNPPPVEDVEDGLGDDAATEASEESRSRASASARTNTSPFSNASSSTGDSSIAQITASTSANTSVSGQLGKIEVSGESPALNWGKSFLGILYVLYGRYGRKDA